MDNFNGLEFLLQTFFLLHIQYSAWHAFLSFVKVPWSEKLWKMQQQKNSLLHDD